MYTFESLTKVSAHDLVTQPQNEDFYYDSLDKVHAFVL